MVQNVFIYVTGSSQAHL